ncbi:U-scoloptoxin(05)-Cw1a-like isoform X1 [Saccostrea echinata]|uniref:U-scoloptoxin(05)-Cw1a-like isoform X1 n=1 Tax=Saccostrea echinata TaxID=191078 RepID=UPI002A7FAEC1|nr:U-scoloptoxin(05)-Cw1a-like isoform X1 [Saccostrea echinata]
MSWWLMNFIFGLFTFSELCVAVAAINCYKCSSRNFSDPSCHDPFHPAYNNLTIDCGEGRDGRVGLFPARYCTKIKGTSSVDGTETIIRSCSIESLDTNCNQFNLENVLYDGCVSSCETDACNAGYRQMADTLHVITAVMICKWLCCIF